MRTRKLLRAHGRRQKIQNARLREYLAARSEEPGTSLTAVGRSTLSRSDILDLQGGPPGTPGKAVPLSPAKPDSGGPS